MYMYYMQIYIQMSCINVYYVNVLHMIWIYGCIYAPQANPPPGPVKIPPPQTGGRDAPPPISAALKPKFDIYINNFREI